MSENNKPELITNDAELVALEPYDFEFIAAALGLFPYQAIDPDLQTTYRGAFNPGAIINLEITEDGLAVFALHNGEEISMTGVQFAELEKRFKRIADEMMTRAKLQGRIIEGMPQGRRFRQ